MLFSDIKNMPYSEFTKLLKQDQRFEIPSFSGCFFPRENNFNELLLARGLDHWEHLDHEFPDIVGTHHTERFWCVSNEAGEAIVVFDGERLDHYMTYMCDATDENVSKLIRILKKAEENQMNGGIVSDVYFNQNA